MNTITVADAARDVLDKLAAARLDDAERVHALVFAIVHLLPDSGLSESDVIANMTTALRTPAAGLS